ncbi:MAG: VOC family protein [Actinomycetota bacterium]
MTDGTLPLVRGAQLDHVAIAVHDAEETAKLFRDVLGAEFLFFGDNKEQGFRFVQFGFPFGGRVELVTPIGDGFVSRFLDRRGEGVHHVTFKVTDLRSQVERMQAEGVELIMVNLEDPHWKEAFIHPRNAHGVLIQIAESSFSREDQVQHVQEMFRQAVELGLA